MKYRLMAGHQQRKNRIKTALVLSGGGAKGAYQVGVIKTLLEHNIEFDLITGSSIGAFNGALFAEGIYQGLSSDEISFMLETIWHNVDGFLPFNWRGLLKNKLNIRKIPSVFSNQKIKGILNKWIKKERYFFQYTDCQLSVTGTNLNQKKTVVFDFNSKVEVKKAVVASMAYPVGLPSVKINCENYIDGGVLDNAPLKEAILWGADKIYVVFLTPLDVIGANNDLCSFYHTDDEIEYPAWEVLGELVELISANLMYGDLEHAQKINQLIRLINLYQNELPPSFLKQLRDIYKLKKDTGKRILNIIRIAPDKILDPPGTMGFDDNEVLHKLITEGANDAIEIIEKFKGG